MSFALDFSDDVLRSINALDPVVQEQIFDEIDALADGTVPLPVARRSGEARVVHDFILALPKGQLYVFVTVLPEPHLGRLSIVGFGMHLRAAP